MEGILKNNVYVWEDFLETMFVYVWKELKKYIFVFLCKEFLESVCVWKEFFKMFVYV